MTRPRLLDLFCGAGGAAVGYHRAGFDVTGVDNRPQPRYPFQFHQADAMTYPLDGYDAIHASPVCKLYSAATPAWARKNHQNQIPPIRKRLEATGLPWVIENVPGAPLRADYKLCGCIMGLPELRRERWFETSWHGFDMRAPCYHPLQPVTVSGHGEPSGPRLIRRRVITVAGGGRDRRKPRRDADVSDWRRVMGINWMTRDELAQAIPPAYTRFIGARLMEHLKERAA